MTYRYNAQVRFAKEQLSDDEYEEILKEFEQFEEIEIETRKKEMGVAQLSDPATLIALNAAGLVVHGTDVLVSIYKIAQAHPGFAGADIQDENGESIQAVGRDYIDVGAVKQETVIENVEGDVYLVRESDIDQDMVRKAGTKHEE